MARLIVQISDFLGSGDFFHQLNFFFDLFVHDGAKMDVVLSNTNNRWTENKNRSLVL